MFHAVFSRREFKSNRNKTYILLSQFSNLNKLEPKAQFNEIQLYRLDNVKYQFL